MLIFPFIKIIIDSEFLIYEFMAANRRQGYISLNIQAFVCFIILNKKLLMQNILN